MSRTAAPWVRRMARPLALFLALNCAAPLALAAEPSPAAGTLEPRPVTTATAAKLATLDPTEAALATAQTTTSEPASDNRSFFKSPKGVLALALTAAGVGYAIYSSQNDRIKSPIR